MKPLPASSYLLEYGISDGDQDLLKKLGERDLFTTTALSQRWPGKEWYLLDPLRLDVDITSISSKSLREICIRPCLEVIITNPQETLAILERYEVPNSLILRLRDRMIEQAMTLEPSVDLLRLLGRVLQENAKVDLGLFKLMTAKDLSVVSSDLGNKLKVLSLLNRPDFTESDLQIVLRICAEGGSQAYKSREKYPNLKTIILVEMPGIFTNFITILLRNYEVHYTALLRCPFDSYVKELGLINAVPQFLLFGGILKDYKNFCNDIPILPSKMVNGLLNFLKWRSKNPL